jgi:hypothetical protein
MRSLVASALAIVIVSISGAAAFADEWKVVRLRGSVLQHVDGEWQKLSRGGMVPDDRVIRTLKTGNVELQRGNETITIGPDTQIQIFDEESTKPFTTVKQYFGKVTVDAEARKVEHFAVQTPYLAAVVKGTKFVVTSGETGADVAVKRGRVFVEDKATKESTTLNVGQSASVDDGGQSMMVAGWGIGAPQPVTPAADDSNATPSGKAQNSAAKTSGNGNSGNGGNNGNGNAGNSGNSGPGASGNGNSGNGNGSGNAGNGNGGSGSGNNGNGNANGHGKNGKG